MRAGCRGALATYGACSLPGVERRSSSEERVEGGRLSGRGGAWQQQCTEEVGQAEKEACGWSTHNEQRRRQEGGLGRVR